MDRRDLLASVLVDDAIAAAMMPWACPCDFGPGARYHLIELTAVGRESLVYRAHDRLLSSEGFQAAVAVKVVRGEKSEREALTARRVAHPNVLRVLDRGIDEGSGACYMVTEFVEGGDLGQATLPWPPMRAVAFMIKVARGVQAAHAAGVVHCDLKPPNIFITAEGDPKVGDFDLAAGVLSTDETPRGNVAFMSPEQFAREENALSPPSDIYALGGLLYYLLTGQLPNGATPAEVELTHRTGNHVNHPAIKGDLGRIIARAMDPKRLERHNSAGELADDLERWQRHEPIPWLKPGFLRRAWLGAARHPRRAATLAVAVLTMSTLVGVTTFTRVSEAHRERRAQEHAIRLANEKVEQISEKARGTIRLFNQMLIGNANRKGIDQVLPALVWLDLLSDSTVIDGATKTMITEDRITALTAALGHLNDTGQSRTIDAGLTRYALAYFKIEAEQYEAAAALLDQNDELLVPRLDADDSLRVSLAAMRRCVEAAQQPRDHVEAAAQDLTALATDLQRQGVAEPVRRLVMAVVRRLREQARIS